LKKSAVKRGIPQSKVKTQPEQHYTAISATAELLFSFV